MIIELSKGYWKASMDKQNHDKNKRDERDERREARQWAAIQAAYVLEMRTR